MLESIPKRYILCLFAFTGLILVGIIRSTLAIAIVAMVKSTANHTVHHDTSSSRTGFEWNSKTQGYLLSAFYYTASFVALPMGFISLKVSPKWLIGIGTGIMGLTNVLLPLCARAGPAAVFILRLIQGSGGAVFLPSMHTLWAKWAPKQDRSLLPVLTLSGSYFGTLLSMIFGGLIASYWSWEWCFYLPGILTVIWLLLWSFFVSELPSSHPTITDDELDYIESNLEGSLNPNHPIPWKAMLTSVPVLAVSIQHLAVYFTVYFFLNDLPTFLTGALDYSVHQAGLWSSVPWLLFCLGMCIGGYSADKLIQFHRVVYVRKLIVALSAVSMVLLLLLLALIPVSYHWTILICIIFILASAGLNIAGFFSNHLDIGAHYAGVLLGITNGISTIAGIAIPTIAGHIVQDSKLKSEWNLVFYLLIGVTIFGAAIYVIFASGELQPWVEQDISERQHVLSKSSSSSSSEDIDLKKLNNTDELK